VSAAVSVPERHSSDAVVRVSRTTSSRVPQHGRRKFHFRQLLPVTGILLITGILIFAGSPAFEGRKKAGMNEAPDEMEDGK